MLKSFVTPPPFLFFFPPLFLVLVHHQAESFLVGIESLRVVITLFFFLFFMRVLLALYQCKLFLSVFLSVSVFLCVDQDFFAMGNRLLSAGLTYSVYVHLALPKYCACVGACVWLCGVCVCV